MDADEFNVFICRYKTNMKKIPHNFFCASAFISCSLCLPVLHFSVLSLSFGIFIFCGCVGSCLRLSIHTRTNKPSSLPSPPLTTSFTIHRVLMAHYSTMSQRPTHNSNKPTMTLIQIEPGTRICAVIQLYSHRNGNPYPKRAPLASAIIIVAEFSHVILFGFFILNGSD